MLAFYPTDWKCLLLRVLCFWASPLRSISQCKLAMDVQPDLSIYDLLLSRLVKSATRREISQMRT